MTYLIVSAVLFVRLISDKSDKSVSFFVVMFFVVKFQVPSYSYAIPLQIPYKSHFRPILRNGLEADLKRT